MDADQFEMNSPGTLIPTVSGQVAFIPNPLPPKLDMSKLIEPLQKTALEIGNLRGIARLIDNPFLVIRPLQRQEALLSSAMEGTHTTADALAMADADSCSADPTTREVFNYITAYEAAHKLLADLPISNRLIKAAHVELLRGLANARSKRPGEFKDQQNFIGGRTRSIADARFVPPPPGETLDCMSELENYINREKTRGIPPLIDAALIHYQFETIHPFSDGNGRIGRMLIPLYLVSKQIIDLPILYVSPVVEGRKDEYVDLMLAVSQRNEWTAWVCFFLEIVRDSCVATAATIQNLLNLRSDFRQMLGHTSASPKIQLLIDELFVQPVTSIPRIQQKMKVTYPTAASWVKALENIGILSLMHGHNHPKYYICKQIIRLTDPNN